MANKDEIRIKEQRVREYLEREKFAAVLLTRRDNFAWMTGGGQNYVCAQSDMGFATLLITRDKKFLMTTNIEAPRFAEEEIGGQGYEIVTYPWLELDGRIRLLREILPIGRPGADEYMQGTDILPGNFKELRYSLTSHEIERFKALGADCGKIAAETVSAIEPGETEAAIAGRVADACHQRMIQPYVILVAADERIRKHRHPIFTNKKVKKQALVVLCGERHGLICSVTRIVHFGKLPAELRKKHDATTAIDAAMIAATRPGTKIGDVLKVEIQRYAAEGFADEWKLHHQGGPCSYAARDFLATPDEPSLVQPNQAFAWNPSITGTKSEDTLIVIDGRPQVISFTGDWPKVSCKVVGAAIQRPDILVK